MSLSTADGTLQTSRSPVEGLTQGERDGFRNRR